MHKCPDSRGWAKSKWDKPKQIHAEKYHNKILKTEDKGNILKAARKTVPYP